MLVYALANVKYWIIIVMPVYVDTCNSNFVEVFILYH